jgi:hypothetical protein
MEVVTSEHTLQRPGGTYLQAGQVVGEGARVGSDGRVSPRQEKDLDGFDAVVEAGLVDGHPADVVRQVLGCPVIDHVLHRNHLRRG